jgi:iron complex outermembrane receptor protein
MAVLACAWILFASLVLEVGGAERESARRFDIPAGVAPDTLDRFSEQSGEQIVYLVDKVRGARTNAVVGEQTSEVALEVLLAGSGLAVQRTSGGAMLIGPDPRASASSARLVRAPATAALGREEAGEVVVLSAFDVSPDGADRYRSSDAISAVRVRAPLQDTPASISVVTREMIDDLVPTRIFDVTRYVAGVQEGRGVQFQDRMIIRGFESNGQRSVDNFIQPNDADNVDEAVIDRVEITKGPNAILSPAGAPGGSINVVTKSPLFRPARSLTTVLGLFDAQKATLDLGGPLNANGTLAYRTIASVQDSRRYWASDARLRGRVLAPMLTWRISDQTALTVKLVGAEHWIFREPLVVLDPSVNATTRHPFLAPGLGAKGRNGIQRWSHVGTHTGDVFALLTTSLAEGIELRVAANGRLYFEDSEQNFLATPSFADRYDPYSGELTQDHVWSFDVAGDRWVPVFSPFFDASAVPNRADLQETRRSTGNVQADFLVRRRAGGVGMQTVAGMAVSRQTGYGRGRNGLMPPIDLADPLREVRPIYADEFWFHNRNSATNAHLYLNQRLDLFDERLHLAAGILHYETRTRFEDVAASSAPTVLDDGRGMWTFSALVRPTVDLALYYSRSQNASPVIADGAPIWREGVQDEIGFKTEFLGGRLALTGAWFRIEQTNVTIPNPARQTDLGAPETLVSDYGNHGFECELVGALGRDLSVVATWSKLHMRDSLGRRVRGVADDSAALLLNYRLPPGRLHGLSLTLGASWTGRRAGDVPIPFTPLGVVGKTSFFLRPHLATTFGASWKWSDRVLLRLNIDNLLDEDDVFVVAGGRVSGTGITMQPGRNVKLSTTLRF